MARATSGFAAAAHRGGMPMFMRMIYDEKLAQAAYLIGCQRTGEAVVIDPERDVDRYIDLAHENGLRIVTTAETHIHADFVSGSRELAERVGAKVYVSDEGDADWKYEWLDQKVGGGSYDYQLLKHGDSFKIGNVELKAIHTPGHTPEHIVFLVTDHGANATEPIGMATGDFVFVGDLGRPDLLETAAGQAGAMEPSARRLFSTVKKLGRHPGLCPGVARARRRECVREGARRRADEHRGVREAVQPRYPGRGDRAGLRGLHPDGSARAAHVLREHEAGQQGRSAGARRAAATGKTDCGRLGEAGHVVSRRDRYAQLG
jgi:glyoxylase-like metal-dependent hydrolase (beta-lactamase superfamily II)